MTDDIVVSEIVARYTRDEFKPVEKILGDLLEVIEFQEDVIAEYNDDSTEDIEKGIHGDIDRFLEYVEEQLSDRKISTDDVGMEVEVPPRIGREYMEEMAHTMESITNKVLTYGVGTDRDLQVFYGKEYNELKIDEEIESSLSNEKGFGGLWTSPLSDRADMISEWQRLISENGWHVYSQPNTYQMFRVAENAMTYEVHDKQDLVDLGEIYTDMDIFRERRNMGISREEAYKESIDWNRFYEDYDAIEIREPGIEPYDIRSSRFVSSDVLEDLGTFTKHENIESLTKKSSDTIIEIKSAVGLPVTDEDLEYTTRGGYRRGRENIDRNAILTNIRAGENIVDESTVDLDDSINIDDNISSVDDDQLLDNYSTSIKQSFIPAIKYHDTESNQGTVIDLTNIDVGSLSKEITVYVGIIDLLNRSDIEVENKIKSIVRNYLVLYLKQLLTIARIYR